MTEPETRIQIEYDDQTPLEPGQYLVKMMDDTGVEVTAEIHVGKKIGALHHLKIGGMPVIFPVRVATPSGALVASLYDGLMHAFRMGTRVTRDHLSNVVHELCDITGQELKEADDG